MSQFAWAAVAGRWDVNKRYLFLIVLEASNSRIKVPEYSLSGESPLPSSKIELFSLPPHMAEGARELSRGSYKDTNCIHENFILISDHLSNVLIPNAMTLGIIRL